MSKPEFVYVTYIRTTPEKLWQALTSSEFSRRYWFGTELRSNFKVGSPFTLVMGGKVTDTGEILEADRPRRLLVQAVGPRVSHQFDRPWAASEPRRGQLVVIGLKGLDRGAIARALAG